MRISFIFVAIGMTFVAAAPAHSMSLFLNSFSSDKTKLSYYCTQIRDYVVQVNNGEPAEYVSVDDIGHVNSMLDQLNAMALAPAENFKAEALEQIELYNPQNVPIKVSEAFYKGEFFGCKSAMSYHVSSTYQAIEKRPEREAKDDIQKEDEELSMSPWRVLRKIFFN